MTGDTQAEKQAADDFADLKTAVTATVTEGDIQAPTTSESALQAESEHDFPDDDLAIGVIDIDLSPIQPNFLPTNLQFQVDDPEDEWTFSYNFDFIFAHMMTGSIGDFPKFFAQSFNALSPGGWIECQDITFPAQCDDGTLKKDSYIEQWSSFMIEATNKFGRTAESAKFYKQQMIDAGFVNVTEVVYKWPTNRWPADPSYKELGPRHVVYGQKPEA
ncbi:hypothetical protein FANTH_9016 [Fusarium anthophilum]|uniref:Methyltransferase n=1 Tax=Fusarium anthophilum TaxID=48485 RepID=A0A8H4Z993_9HYPO|nr:hypothetical protein FANTH_9016 [Fusarium anthophilum]